MPVKKIAAAKPLDLRSPTEPKKGLTPAPPSVRHEDTSLGWVQDLFKMFGQEAMLDQPIGQDALAVAVKTSAADRRTLLDVLRKLLPPKLQTWNEVAARQNRDQAKKK